MFLAAEGPWPSLGHPWPQGATRGRYRGKHQQTCVLLSWGSQPQGKAFAQPPSLEELKTPQVLPNNRLSSQQRGLLLVITS